MTTNGPTVWGNAETGEEYGEKLPGTEVSADKASATVTRKEINDGFIFGSWELTKEDPKGHVKIEILFKDKVIHTFNYVIE